MVRRKSKGVVMNAEQKIERIRNLIIPIVNYFKIQQQLHTGDYEDKDYDSLDKILYKTNIKSYESISEIVKILKDEVV